MVSQRSRPQKGVATRPPGPRLLFATRNPGKLREVLELLDGLDWQIEGLPPGAPDCEETGASFADNARGKALFTSRSTDLPVLADDSGLVIDALGGEPGVHSARYLDPAMEQAQRNRAVLAKLTGVKPENRTARFICHLVLAYRGRFVHETRGSCEGLIADRARGGGGFGYDPIFLAPELGRTFAELSGEEKTACSHRGAAVRAMARYLAGWRPGVDEIEEKAGEGDPVGGEIREARDQLS
ncbi:MAG: RdgB/HAM1 family non-canonical purine NTP pyrophosphatase [Acidobacteriota bacterium]